MAGLEASSQMRRLDCLPKKLERRSAKMKMQRLYDLGRLRIKGAK